MLMLFLNRVSCYDHAWFSVDGRDGYIMSMIVLATTTFLLVPYLCYIVWPNLNRQ